MRRDGFHSNNPRRPLRTGQERRRAECSLAHGKALPAAKPPLARRCAASRADPLAIGRGGRPLYEGSEFFPKASRRAKSEMTENAVECAVCEADSRPSRALVAQNAWSRNSHARFRARRVHIRPRFRSSAACTSLEETAPREGESAPAPGMKPARAARKSEVAAGGQKLDDLLDLRGRRVHRVVAGDLVQVQIQHLRALRSAQHVHHEPLA